jgi:hypothetical protein
MYSYASFRYVDTDRELFHFDILTKGTSKSEKMTAFLVPTINHPKRPTQRKWPNEVDPHAKPRKPTSKQMDAHLHQFHNQPPTEPAQHSSPTTHISPTKVVFKYFCESLVVVEDQSEPPTRKQSMTPPPTGDHHRSSWMKQANKSHKTNARSSRELNRIRGGKVRVGSVGGASTGGSSVSSAGRTARANKVVMIRRNKREALLLARRVGGAGTNTGGIVVDGAPLNVALVGLSAQADLDAVVASLATAAGPLAGAVANTATACVPQTLVYAKDKLRISVLPCARSTLAVLDAAKAADIVVFVLKVRWWRLLACVRLVYHSV